MKVYAKLMGGLASWEIGKDDPELTIQEALQAVRDEATTNPSLTSDGAVLVLIQGGKDV
jgi:hypothetical protein